MPNEALPSSASRLIAERLDAFVCASIAVECWLLSDEGVVTHVGDVGSRADLGSRADAGTASRSALRGEMAIGQRVTDVFPALSGLPLDAPSIIEFLSVDSVDHTDGFVDLHYFPHQQPAALIVRDVTREAHSIRAAQAPRNDEALGAEILAHRLALASEQARLLELVAGAIIEAVLRLDNLGMVSYSNGALERWFGCAEGSFVGKHFLSMASAHLPSVPPWHELLASEPNRGAMGIAAALTVTVADGPSRRLLLRMRSDGNNQEQFAEQGLAGLLLVLTDGTEHATVAIKKPYPT